MFISTCDGGTCIRSAYICDGSPDCKDLTDELQSHCKQLRIVHEDLDPDFYHYNDLSDCLYVPLHDGTYMCLVIVMHALFLYSNKFNIYDSSDNYVDTLTERCSNGRSFCGFGRKQCYPSYKRCIFERDMVGLPVHCDDTEHLKFCAHVQCPAMFKCRQVS